MIQTTMLEPHDPLPSGRHVVVLRRLEEDDPAQTTVQIILTGTPEQTTHPRAPDGTAMPFEQAIEAARRVAETEGLHRVFVLDRTKGMREREVLDHGGDHTVNMAALSDTDLEDGVQGSDMRDVTHRS